MAGTPAGGTGMGRRGGGKREPAACWLSYSGRGAFRKDVCQGAARVARELASLYESRDHVGRLQTSGCWEGNPMSHPANAWQNDPVKVARLRQADEDLSWAIEHYAELDQQYRGEYVAVNRKQVVAHHADLGQLFEQAARAGFCESELAIMPVASLFE